MILKSAGARSVVWPLPIRKPFSRTRHQETAHEALFDCFSLLIRDRDSRQASAVSATEEEFDEAVSRGIPILVLRQQGELELEQQAFLDRAS